MPNFEYLEDKQSHHLEKDDMILHQDKFWRIVENYNVLGYPPHTRRMLVILPHQFELTPYSGFKFLEIGEGRIPAYRKTE